MLVVKRTAIAAVLCALLPAACGGGQTEPAVQRSPDERPTAIESTVPGTVTRGDSSTDLDRTPVSAADYQMYVAIMGGASAMLSGLSDADKAALELAKKVESGAAQATAANEPLLAQARALRERDLELARLQGIEPRYRKVKEKIEAVIGPKAQAPAAGDTLAIENLRYLEANRATIERLQKIVNDPLSRPAGTSGPPAQ